VSSDVETTFCTRNARFLWLVALFVPAMVAFGAYQLMPHEYLWQEIVFGLLCVPLFCIWLVAVVGCVISFLSYRSLLRS
jgi:hypothetical protein